MTTTTATTCPLCGGDDATRTSYDARRRDLRVEHADGTRCSAAPVDASGNYLA